MISDQLLEQCHSFGEGTKAFYDAFTCVLSCTVLEVLEPGNGFQVTRGRLRIRCDEPRGPYKRGEVMEVSAYHTFPRSHRRVNTCGQYRILPWYRWVNK